MHAPFWLKAVTFTVLVRLVKSKRSASDLALYHISAQLILLTYYSRYTGGTAVDTWNGCGDFSHSGNLAKEQVTKCAGKM